VKQNVLNYHQNTTTVYKY